MVSITVEGEDREEIIKELGGNLEKSSDIPKKLDPVIETLILVLDGLEEATNVDDRGKSRKKISEFAGIDDMFSSQEIAYFLRTLESHDLVVQNGNRWSLSND